MRVVVFVPDGVFAEAEQTAKRLGLTRSELYSRAIATYVAKLRAEDVTEALDRVYVGGAERDAVLAKHQRRMLARERW